MALPYIESRERIYTTIAAGSSSTGDNTDDITISSVTMGQTMFFWQVRAANNSRRGHCTPEFVNSTTLRAHRYDNRSALEIEIQVIEWDSSVTVQHDYTYTASSDADTFDFTLSAITIANAFPLWACSSDQNNYGRNNEYKYTFTSTTNLRLERNSNGIGAMFMGIQVVEHEDFDVQHVTVSFDDADTSVDTTITAVTLANTFCIAGFSVINNFNLDESAKYELTSTTNLRIERASAAVSADQEWTIAVVECAAFTVQKVTQNCLSTDGISLYPTITSVDTSRSFVFIDKNGLGGQNGIGYSTDSLSSAVGNFRNLYALTDFDSSTSVHLYRSRDTANVEFRFYVVEVAAASSDPIVSEVVGVTESIIRNLTMVRRVSETEGITESPKPLLGLVRFVSETLGISENSKIIRGLVRLANENIGIIETISTVRGLVRSVSETITINEDSKIAKGLIRIISETIGITTSIIPILTSIGGALVRVVSETIGLSENALRNLGLVRKVSETQSITESTNRSLGLVRRISETIGTSETIDSIRGLVRRVTETIGISEVTKPVRGLIRRISENVTINESITSIKGLVRIIAETVGISTAIVTALSLVVVSYVGITAVNVANGVRFLSMKVQQGVRYVRFRVNDDIIDNE